MHCGRLCASACANLNVTWEKRGGVGGAHTKKPTIEKKRHRLNETKSDYINRIIRKCFTEHFREDNEKGTQIKINKIYMKACEESEIGKFTTRKLCVC